MRQEQDSSILKPEHTSAQDYSSRVQQSLPFILLHWWHSADASIVQVGSGRFTSGNWLMQSDPRCDASEVDYPEY